MLTNTGLADDTLLAIEELLNLWYQLVAAGIVADVGRVLREGVCRGVANDF